jgi:hypothetical protein
MVAQICDTLLKKGDGMSNDIFHEAGGERDALTPNIPNISERSNISAFKLEWWLTVTADNYRHKQAFCY